MGIPTVWEEDKENIFIVRIAVRLVTLVIRCLSEECMQDLVRSGMKTDALLLIYWPAHMSD